MPIHCIGTYNSITLTHPDVSEKLKFVLGRVENFLRKIRKFQLSKEGNISNIKMISYLRKNARIITPPTYKIDQRFITYLLIEIINSLIHKSKF